jgi:hypothetical protein
MPIQSTGRDLHIDRLLSQMAIGYTEHATIAGTIAPVVQVDKQGDKYSVFSRADALRTEDAQRSPGTEARKISRSVSSDSYYAQNYALKYPITIEDRENADEVYRQQLINDAARYVTGKLALGWEQRVSTLCFTAANVGSSSGVGSEWDAAASSNPVGNINTAIDNVHDLTGTRPNRIIMGLAAWRSLRRNDQILNRIFGSNNGGGYPNTDQVANLLEIEQISVGGAFRNSANEAQAETLVKIWGDSVLCYYTPSAPSRDEPSFMYSFRWATGGLPNMQAERHPFDPKTKSEEVEVGYYQVEKITGSQYGFLLLGVNSST